VSILASDRPDAAPADTPGRVVLLADTRTPAEQELVTEWAHTAHPEAELAHRDDPGLAQRLADEADPLVLPARVTWLPSEGRNGTEASTAGDLRALISPRRPPALLQRWIARRTPQRARITVGEGARASELQREFRAETGGSGGEPAFAAFVARRATLACDRAERAILGDRYKVPRLVAEQIGASAAFRGRVAELADRLERPFDEVFDEVTSGLTELAAVQSPPAIDAFRAFMGPMHRRAWRVVEDPTGLERLRELNRRHALVFLPAHRSYVDPLVLADVLHRHDFPRNHVLGGNNMAFWPIGPLGKRAGLIFIRRSFGDDHAYKLAVREYFGHLVAKRFNLEWYIEGGRSRTGKLRPPRYGLLHYLVRAIEDGHGDDVVLVPVAMAYEQLQEVGAIAAEHGGAKKSAEGLGWLANYVRAQSTEVGTAQVRFGEPISLRTALDEAGEGSAQLEKVAFRICVGINRATPATATGLVTFALLDVRDRALTLAQVRQVIAPLLDLLEARGVPCPLEDLRRRSGVERTLAALVRAGVIECYDEGSEPVWSIARDRHHVAAFYRNGVIHHFVNRAVVELALLGVASRRDPGDVIEVAWEDALALRDLLKFEFFFSDKERFREELLEELAHLGWSPEGGRSSGDAADLLAGAPVLVSHGTLRSFVDAQLVVARRLVARNPREAIDKGAFLDECLAHGRQLLLQGRLHSGESVSRELFDSALKLAANRDLVDPGREPVAAARQAWLEELLEVRERLLRVSQLDEARLEEVLDVPPT
jgi:glycerol-3-phosphate O-acyltransferase